MGDLRAADAAAESRLAWLAHALGSRCSSGHEVLVGLLVAGAILLGYSAVAGRIELLSRLYLWYQEKELWVERNLSTSDGVHNSASPAQRAPSDFRLARNPFLAFTGEAGFRYHPLIDIVGAQFNGNFHFFKQRDFFGFRNKFNAYFDPGDYTYIVMTGNSELVGISHNVPIAENLANILNARSRKKYRVLNLGLKSATTANEINYFVNLAFNLHPEFVISHSFITDMVYGYQVAPEFQSIGMFYQGMQGTWMRLIDAENYDPKGPERLFGPPSEKHLLEGFTRNLERYRAVAQASGARFIFGLQKFDETHVKGTPSEADWARVKRMYERFKVLLRTGRIDVDVIDFNTVPGIQLSSPVDPIHTTDVAARRIAEIYADHILALEREK